MSDPTRVYTFSIDNSRLAGGCDFLAELETAGVVVDVEYGVQPRDPSVFHLCVARGAATEEVVRKLKQELDIDAYAEPVQQAFKPAGED